MSAHDQMPPEFRDIRSYTDVPFDCATHGHVYQVLMFNQDPARTFCAQCFEDFLLKPATGILKASKR